MTKIASGLTRLGFGKGDVLCMFCSNFVEYWLIALATWTCGGCVMPLNCEMEPKNLEYQLTLGKAKILVCDELNIGDAIGKHSSKISCLCLMKCPSETLQNLPYFWNTQVSVFHFVLLYFSPK